MRRLVVVAILTAVGCGPEPLPEPTLPPFPPPYPESEAMRALSFDWDTHRREAIESDNWPLTWADDGHQYTAWGDGFGFEGDRPKKSLGFSRIVGDADSYRGEDLFYGDPQGSDLEYDAKSYGVLALDDQLYAWLSPGSTADAWRFSRLYRSDDRGRSWIFTGVEVPGKTGMAMPWFLQAGQNYSERPDEYVYTYFLGVQNDTIWDAQTPGLVDLTRVALSDIEDFAAYEFFADRDSTGAPMWTSDIERRQPVIRDRNGLMVGSTIYVPKLDRFLFAANHTVRDQGNLAIFEGPSPWGPWHTVLYEVQWGAGHIPVTTFYWNFSPKWLSEDGRDFVLVFTGRDRNDSWNSVRGRFHPAEPEGKP